MRNHPTVASSTVAIIGSGFGGLGMAHYLKQAGIDDITLFEKADEVGGTWRENTYPGAACDIPSHLYSFSFEPGFGWNLRYARQAQLLDYLKHCAKKYAIYPHIRFGTEVRGAQFDETRGVWVLSLSDGSSHEARVLVSSVGQLHRPAMPRIPGTDRFKGKAFHSAQWDQDYELSGKRVAVIGTGASAVQFVPEIAKQVKQLHVFQRSPAWVIPKLVNDLPAPLQKLLDWFPALHHLDRARIFLTAELMGIGYHGRHGRQLVQKILTRIAKSHLRKQVTDPQIRAKLTPNYSVGCKRLLISNDWLPALTRPNVELVTDAISEITETGVRTADGRLREVDAIIYGTGFQTLDFLAPMQIQGLGERTLETQWKSGAQAYLGMTVPGFPNFFMLYGPNTNLGAGSIVYMLEHQQRYIVQLVKALQNRKLKFLDVRDKVAAEYNRWIQQRSQHTTYAGDCQSWYKTEGGLNTNNWVGPMREYQHLTQTASLEDYRLVTAEQQDTLQRAA